MKNAIKLIFLKELKEMLRDHRSLLTVIGLSILMPLSSMVGMFYISAKAESSENAAITVIGAEHAPDMVRWLETKQLKNKPDSAVELIIPENYQQSLETGYIARLTIRANVSSEVDVLRKLRESLEVYSGQIAQNRLMARGVSPIIMRPMIVDIQDTGSAPALIRFIAPLIVFLLLMTPGYALMPASIDCTAGERERHGLFPLLLQPIPPIAIPIGKWLMLSFVGLCGLSLAITSGFIGLSFVKFDGMSIGLNMSPLTGLTFLIVAAPIVMTLAAFMMAMASFAKTFKEGQTYVGICALIPIAFSGGGFLLDEKYQPYMPFWAENTVLSGIMSGQAFQWLPILLLYGVYGITTYGLLYWMSRSMRRGALQSS